MNAVLQTHQSVIGLPVSYDSYIRHGWSLCPVPPGSKGPQTPGWNKQENALTIGVLPHGHGVGLMHAYSGTMALDLDAWDDAVVMLKQHNIDLDALYAAQDAVIIDSGRQGHGKLLYAMPFGLTLPSKKITDQNGKVVYELRCASSNGLSLQDVLPPSMHPLTLQPYRWAGKGRWTDLPIIPMPLLDLWQDLIKREAKITMPTGTVDASWDDIKKAVFTVPADCSREDWLSIGMALHHAGTTTDQETQAFYLWDEWSATATTKYKGQRDLQICWRSFHSDNNSPITLGTLFHIAMKYGYQRPTPDVSDLFKKGAPVSPLELTESLRNKLPQINPKLFPPLLRQRAEEISLSVNCDVSIPLFAGLAVVCAAVDGRSKLTLMNGYDVPPILWSMVIGDPSTRKTPGAQPMFSILRTLEKESIPNFKRDMLKWEYHNAAWAKSKKAWSDKAGNAESVFNIHTDDSGNTSVDDSVTEGLIPDPGKPPIMPALMVKDITSQKVARMCAEHQRGLLCFLDEMKGWMDKITDKGSGEDRSTWTMGYNGAPHTVDRVGEAERIIIDNFSLSIFGNVQPLVYKEAQKKLGTDGLLQRFIPIPLRDNPHPINQDIPAFMTNVSDWENHIRKIYNLPITTYTLSEGAYTLFREFQLWSESSRKDHRLLHAVPQFLEAYGKLDGLLGRLAFIFHLLENPDKNSIDESTVKKAIWLIKTYIIPAYSYCLGSLSGEIEDSFDYWLQCYIVSLSSVQDTITYSEIKRSAKRQIEGLSEVDKVELIRYSMAQLENSRWVVMTHPGDKGRTTTWAINPELARANETYRMKIIRAKQRQLDDVANAIRLSSGSKAPRIFTPGYDPSMDNN